MNENQPTSESDLLDKAVRQLKNTPARNGPPSEALDNVLAIPQSKVATKSIDSGVSTRGGRRTSPNSRRAIWSVTAVCLLVAIAAGWWIVRSGRTDRRDVAVRTSDKDRDKKQGQDDGKVRSYLADDGYDDDRGDAKYRGNGELGDANDKDPSAKFGNSGKDKYSYGDSDYQSSRDGAETLIVGVSDAALGNNLDAGGAPLPFGLEQRSDDIALGVVGKPFERDGKMFVPLDIIEVYKGRLPTGRFVADDREVFHVECTVSERLGLRSELFKPRARVGVYFLRDPKKGWTVSWIRPMADREDWWRKMVKLFCDVQLAPEAKDPAARYGELLLGDELDSAAYHALSYNPSPHAVPTLRKLWQRVVMSQPNRAFSVASLLAMLHDAESVETVLDFALHQENMAIRQMYFETLPRLCQDADEETIRKAQRKLKDFHASLTPEEVKASKDLHLRSGYYSAEALHGALETLLNKRRSKDGAVPTDPTESQ